MAFENLKIPDNSWILNTRIKPLPGAIVDGFQQGLHLKDLFTESAMKQFKLNEARRTDASVKAQDELAKKYPQNTPAGRKQTATELSRMGFGPESAEMQKQAEEWEQKLKDQRAANKEANRKLLALGASHVKSLPMQFRVQGWWKLRQELKEDGYDISDLPATPSQELLDHLESQGMSIKEREMLDLDRDQLNETIRHNKATEENDRNKPARTGSPATGLTVAYDAAGNMIVVDKVNKTSAPVSGQGGVVQKFQSDPTKITEAIAINKSKLNQISNALAAAESYKKATGLVKGFAGTYEPTSAILNKVDPQGVNARALVADIGSGKIHERSGAAVSLSETPRLKPFIPSPFDDYETIKKKLTNFKKYIEDENRELEKILPSSKVYDPQIPDEVEDAEFAPVDEGDDSTFIEPNWSPTEAPPALPPPQPSTPGTPPKKKRNWSYGG